MYRIVNAKGQYNGPSLTVLLHIIISIRFGLAAVTQHVAAIQT